MGNGVSAQPKRLMTSNLRKMSGSAPWDRRPSSSSKKSDPATYTLQLESSGASRASGKAPEPPAVNQPEDTSSNTDFLRQAVMAKMRADFSVGGSGASSSGVKKQLFTKPIGTP